ncbi:hypothetical protein EW026_g2506 [Hermanssonia centrifuga]|uniref:Amidohydrolase-related domain-containing protein n=1 Tax=Hermanssonia centrifuga TaxID=98765 RepID=A0A4S4KP26_9APHY|nr:hypothetical protein EW026_g2506 [Hermanssonia centrifuga]
MFAAFARYKREAYRHSEFAPRVLADNDIDVIMKSDHPAIVSRYLIHEAAQAHYYGLADNIALASVISTPARVLGLDHRIGYIKEGFDADIVLWDSHPLALGATPTQVIIDGIPQLSSPHKIAKPHSSQSSPHTPDFELEIAEAIDHAGLPPLGPLISRDGLVLFTNVSSLWIKTSDSLDLMDMFQSNLHGSPGSVVVSQGRIICHGMDSACAGYTLQDGAVVAVVDLQGGSLQPGLASVGSMLGLQEISMEQSTTDGEVYNVLDTDPPSIVGGVGYLPRAVDGLVYGTRDALLAYRAGVTVGITPPSLSSFVGGLSTAFSLGSLHKLESGAIVQETAALHVSLAHGDVPGSTKGKLGESFQKVSKGQIPLVVAVNSADIIAALVNLKLEVEMKSGTTLKLTIIGGAEAHLLAAELAKANVGVILYPPRPLAYTWDHRRIIPGLPLSKESAIAHLISSGVTVGIGPQGTSGIPSISTWAARNLRFDAGWALLDSPHVLSKASALALASSNVEKLLGVEIDPYESDLVATSGGDLLSFEGKVVAVISPRKGRVDLF